LSSIADQLWYPIWDAGMALDHSVRTVDDAMKVARDDLKAAVGLIDARHIAGRVGIASRLREQALAGWRASAPHRIAELRADAAARAARRGELAHLIEPDLKESFGGLREATALRALSASWLVDVPRSGVAEATTTLLDVRDALHRTTGRSSDQVLMQDHESVAAAAGYRTTDDLLRAVSGAGRTLAYATEVAWYRAERITARPSRRGLLRRRGAPQPASAPLADGVVEQDGEAVLAREVDPATEPGVGLRLAAAAAQAGLRVSPAALERIRAATHSTPDPWTDQMRDSLVTLLGAGRAAVDVWEALDQVGLWDRWLPGWSRLRGLPQRNPVHRFTVDRHSVEAAVQAAGLTRTVARPDLLLVGALLHDVGKGLPGDHSTVGQPIVEEWARRIGFSDDDVAVLVDLCRWHLLLPETATRRDLDDPETIRRVVEVLNPSGQRGLVGGEGLALLAALTEADARATGPLAWTEWRASLVRELVRRVGVALRADATREQPADPSDDPPHRLADTTGVVIAAAESVHGWSVDLAADDQPGLLAAAAGVLSLNRLTVRGAQVRTVGGRALQTWSVHSDHGDAPDTSALRDDLRAALDGSLDVGARLRVREASYRRVRIAVPEPRVDVVPGASRDATVVEVRAHDDSALMFRVASAIARADVEVRAARVATMGAEAVDVFYLCGADGGPLAASDAARVVGAILDELNTAGE
jgi:[protein-PII] uridylyltransferase